MKISVCGKGGSGKSVVTALLANGMRGKGYQVLVVDADESNTGLYRMLGFGSSPVPILELVGGRKEVRNVFPKDPSPQSGYETNIMVRHEIRLKDVPPQYIFKRDGVSLVSVGKILQALEGCACPMGVLSREFLKKLHLEANTMAIVDMEAGVEHFGRGVETSIDGVLIVVDPSYESLELAEKVRSMVAGIGISNTWVVLNKITSDEIASRLKEELGKRDLDTIGCIQFDPDVFEACLEGKPLQSKKTAHEIERILDTLLSELGRRP